jgi:hypothetical protein
MYIHNGTEAAKKWKKFDGDTVLQGNADGQLDVNHRKSYLKDLKQAGKALLNMVDPTNHFRDSWKNANKGGNDFGIGRMLAVLMIPWDIAREVVDVPAGPIKAAKNLGQAGAHAGAQLKEDVEKVKEKVDWF